MKKSDYTLRGWLLSLFVVVGVVALGAIPSTELFGMQFNRVDILSLLRHDASADEAVEYTADIERLEQELAQLAQPEVIDSAIVEPDPIPVRYEWILEPMAERVAERPWRERVKPNVEQDIIAIEDFDTLAESRFTRFVERLANGENVRIAFMGDSFIEGDILTSDLRAELQEIFGGRGVGFVACDIPFATVRNTVKRTSTGWSSYSVMKSKAAPEALRDKFFVSGYIANGGRGATTKWQSTSHFPTLDSCTRARVVLLSRDSSRVEVAVNDTLTHEFAIAGDERVREIYVEAPLESLRLKVLEGSVLCYGASLEGNGGVVVDNFSVRSNNGHAIFGTGAQINRQVDEMLGYDLVVLQYGLNIMQPGQRQFSKYRDQLRDMIAYAERCFPNAAILVLGVSDRWVKNEESGSYEPIGSVDAMTSYQRAAADSCGVAFWNTSKAMMALGGMPRFVSNGWAAKDYTHINFRGGSRVAAALAAAIRQPVYELLAEQEAEEARIEALRRQEELRREQYRIDRINTISAVLDSMGVVENVVCVLEQTEEGEE